MKTWISAAFALTLAGPALAGMPSSVNYQGQLRESGAPVSGTRSIVFRLCSDAAADCSAAPVQRWQSGASSVVVSTGLFRTSFTPSLAVETDWETMDLWLEVEVAGVKFTPRERLAVVPYALDAHLHMGKHYTTAASAPAAPGVGDLWMDDSSNPGTLNYYNGTGWAAASGGPVSTASVSGQWQTASYGNATVTDAKIVGMSSSKLTGALPAVDGSALTGVTASAVGAGAVADANVAAGANIAKSKISGTGTWAVSDIPSLSTAQITSGQWQTASYGDATVTDAKIVGMSSSKLTGALPAVDGSALTGVTASAVG
ncbi:MAG: hypothetical protein KGL74_01630, partial [Elusimicrobia bacterium]|nr:hypothetical protein [Elusimicrobiota bacterium]